MESWAGVDSPTPSDGEAGHALHGWAPLDEVLEPGLQHLYFRGVYVSTSLKYLLLGGGIC